MHVSAHALRPGIPLLVAALVGAPLLWRLLSVPPPSPIVESFVEGTVEAAARPIAVPYAARIAGSDVFRLTLSASDSEALARSAEVHLLMANYATPANLLEAWLTIGGTPCRFRTRPGAVLQDSAFLVFYRQASCDGHTSAPSGALDLEVRLDVDSGRVAIWGYEPPVAGRVLVASEREPFAVRGYSTTEPPPNTRTRISLLAYVWDVTPAVLWARLRTIALLGVIGLALLWFSPAASARGVAVAAAVFGTAIVMGALALTHALMFPPLQAPDEPIHAFSLSELHDDKEFWEQVVTLGNRTHFARLRHHSFERFRQRDVDRPMNEYWGIEMEFPFAIRERSPATAWWWELIGKRHDRRTVDHLWALRRANAVLLGLVCGATVAILALALPQAQPAAFSLALLAVPTLPFFGGYFSDGTVIVSLSLVLAACIAALVIGTPRATWLGVPLAAALALAWLTGRSAWPLIGAAGIVLAGHALTGGRPAKSRPLHLLMFWTPVAAAIAAGVWLADRAGQFAYLDTFLRRHLPAASAPVHAMVAGIPWVTAAAGIVLATIQWLAARRRWDGTGSRRLAAIVVTTLVAWIVVGCGLSLVMPLPDSALSADARSPTEFLQPVLASMAAPFRLRHHDLLLSTFFWSGMGWVDLVAPLWVLDIAIGATAVALVWSLLQARADAARAVRFLLLFAGLAISLVVYAVGAYGLDYALYGRYLVGWYLLLIVLAWTAPALSHRDWRPWLVVCLALHAYYLQSIPERYF